MQKILFLQGCHAFFRLHIGIVKKANSDFVVVNGCLAASLVCNYRSLRFLCGCFGSRTFYLPAGYSQHKKEDQHEKDNINSSVRCANLFVYTPRKCSK